MATDVTTSTVVSYTAFPPLRRTLACAQGMQAFLRGVSLLHYPGSCLHQTLSGILPCEARTFLSRTLSFMRQRSSILLIRSHIISSFSFSNKYNYNNKNKYCNNSCQHYRNYRFHVCAYACIWLCFIHNRLHDHVMFCRCLYSPLCLVH